MAKVLLVEDDNNLREIYEARLSAEGYEISTAQDGEEALVVAKETQPDLVVSDVMMPKISGFEMLDILRNTPGLEHVKVIMLTALGQGEDKERADSLGADKYLVKSQVTLEDIVKTAHQLLGDEPEAPAVPAATEPEPATTPDVAAPAAPMQDTTATDDAVQPTAAEPVAAPEMAVAEPPTQVSTTADDAATASDDEVAQEEPAATVEPEPATPTEEPLVTAPATEEVVAEAPEITTEPTTGTTDSPASEADDEIIANAITQLETNSPETEPTVTETPTEPEVTTAPAEEAVTAPTETPEETTAETATAPTPTEDQPAATEPNVVEPTATAEEPEEVPEPAPQSSTSIAGKKVIQPLSDSEITAKPDINELLAQEEASTITSPVTDTDSSAGVSPQPGQAITPQAETEVEAPTVSNVVDDTPETSAEPAPTSDKKDGPDPNSIAL